MSRERFPSRRGLGVRSGGPDLLVVVGGQACFLALKAPGGRITTAQSECPAELLAAGARVAVAIDAADALAVLKRWDVLRSDERRTG